MHELPISNTFFVAFSCGKSPSSMLQLDHQLCNLCYILDHAYLEALNPCDLGNMKSSCSYNHNSHTNTYFHLCQCFLENENVNGKYMFPFDAHFYPKEWYNIYP